MDGVQPISDDPMTPRETSWLIYPGGAIQSVCGSDQKAILFDGKIL